MPSGSVKKTASMVDESVAHVWYSCGRSSSSEARCGFITQRSRQRRVRRRNGPPILQFTLVWQRSVRRACGRKALVLNEVNGEVLYHMSPIERLSFRPVEEYAIDLAMMLKELAEIIWNQVRATNIGVRCALANTRVKHVPETDVCGSQCEGGYHRDTPRRTRRFRP